MGAFTAQKRSNNEKVNKVIVDELLQPKSKTHC